MGAEERTILGTADASDAKIDAQGHESERVAVFGLMPKLGLQEEGAKLTSECPRGEL